MKSRQFLVVVFAFLNLGVHSQIIVNQNDMPVAGDTLRLSTVLVPSGINFQQAGANITWDFSSLQASIQRVDTFKTVSSVPLFYQIVFNATVANLASPMPSIDFIPGLLLTDIYEFYRKTSVAYAMAGMGVTFNGLPLPMKYDNPDIWYRFPVTYLSTDSSTSTFSLGFPGVGLYATYRKRVNYVDAWGTVKTPYGIFQCMRIKSYLTTRDSIYVDSLAAGQSLNRQIVEYKWLAIGMKVPVIQINEEGLAITATYRDSLRMFVGVPDIYLPARHVNIFPNPAVDQITVSFVQQQAGMVQVCLFDLTGRRLLNVVNRFFPVGKHTEQVPLRQYGLKNGIYILRFSTVNEIVTSKLLIHSPNGS
ncbi:MAG: T9SS type A sorting domain-containing protein [Bacteroidales bacterium]|nr:T9SS type A sorting domain-containing protein [Bacteroidales bacterium]MDZ4204189.1 T9SS type A sorting domain-containing protein [Bacteroidales bacterium]